MKITLKQYSEAIQDFDTAIQLKPNSRKNEAPYFFRGMVKHRLNPKDVTAIEDLNKSIQLNPNAFNYQVRGEVKYKLNRPTAAIQDYDTAIAFDPNSPDAYLARGLAKADLKQYFEAIQDFDTAIQLFEAIQDYGKAIAFDPNFPGAYLGSGSPDSNYAFAYYNRGLAKSKLNQPAAAAEDYQAALRLARQVDNKALEAIIEATILKNAMQIVGLN